MASQQQSPEKSRRRRQSRHKTAGVANTAASLGEDRVNSRPKTNQKKKNPQQNSSESALSQQLHQATSTISPYQSISGDDAMQNGNKINRKKDNMNGAATPASKKPKNQYGNNTTTPSKPAIEAYAGPTFHASPAPSALPIPKFLSKSAPPIDEDVGITARLKQEDTHGSSGSEQSPDSPSMRSAAKASTAGKIAGPPALFDMLLNADRQEKARQRASHNASPMRSDNSSGAAQRPQHNRTLTAGSIFPIDMDASSGRSTPASVHVQPAAQQVRQSSPSHSNSPRPYSSNDDANLKRMLFSSPASTTPNQYPQRGTHQSSPGWTSSPASRADTSPYGTPSSASSVNGLASSSRPAPVSPYTQASPSPVARRSQFPPQNVSGLRRELSPGQLNLQNTPPHMAAHGFPQTYYNGSQQNSSPLGSPVSQMFPPANNVNGNYSPHGSHGYNSPARNHSPANLQGKPSSKRFSAQDALQASLGEGGSSNSFNVAGMENELRKILRIDDLRVSSAATTSN